MAADFTLQVLIRTGDVALVDDDTTVSVLVLLRLPTTLLWGTLLPGEPERP